MDAIKISSVRPRQSLASKELTSQIPAVTLVEHSYASGALVRTAHTGSLHLTVHHLIFRPTSIDGAEIWVRAVFPPAVSTSHGLTRAQIAHTLQQSLVKTTGEGGLLLLMRLRTFRTWELVFPSLTELAGVWDSLKGLCAPGRGMSCDLNPSRSDESRGRAAVRFRV